jgi:hypothetical protein
MIRRVAPIALAAAFAGALPALATTLIPISDPNLVDRATLIVQATVEEKIPSTAAFPATDWMMTVDRVVKGSYGSSSLVVRVPGGEGPDGMTLRVYGTPAFAPGERALLLLKQRADGSWALIDFPQGAFLAVDTKYRTLAVRDFSEVRVLDHGGHVSGYEPIRQLDRFEDWIADRTTGVHRPADYIVKPQRSELQSIHDQFTLFTASNGLGTRWFQFDSGGSVQWLMSSVGVPGLAGGGATEVQRGLAAWNNESTTPIRLVYGGTTATSGGFKHADGKNVVLWNDPNDEIAGKFNCSVGGTLAEGGPWYSSSNTGTFSGKKFIRIQEGDVVFNDGVECDQLTSPNFSKFIEEISGHEIGHTLGLGHSSEKPNESNQTLKQALMYYRVHDDGRGARLNSDDIAGLQTLYRAGGAGGGGGGGGGGGQTGCPASTLCLQHGRFQLSVTWSNQFDSSSGAGIPLPNSDLAGFFAFTDPRNVELIVKVLDFDGTIKVFYSELTNLHFQLKVTDTSTGRTKTYSNTAGDCGAIDNDFASGTASALVAADTAGTFAAATGSCHASSNTLCLLGNRFAVSVDWRNQYNGTSGFGAARSLSDLTGAFSFDSPSNLELLIKTLDFSGPILVLYGSLSDFDYTIHLTDTTTGKTKDYHNAAGHFCGGLDQNAF